MNKKYDVIIIGSGPGGMTAALYASRAGLKTIIIEKGAPGGKMVTTYKIENWSGDKEVMGPDLSIRMFEHAKSFGAEYKYGDVVKIDKVKDFKNIVKLKNGEELEAKSIIIATGMIEKVPNEVENISNFINKGVSFCAICDGPLYKGTKIAVIGGGDAAIEEATYLSSVASEVLVFVRNKTRAQKWALDEFHKKSNVRIFLKSKIKKILGDNSVQKIIVTTPEGEKEFEVSSVFPYIGHDPVSSFISHLNITNKEGYIITDNYMETSVKGIYAVGDIREKEIRQIATAVADGSIAGKIIANRI